MNNVSKCCNAPDAPAYDGLTWAQIGFCPKCTKPTEFRPSGPSEVEIVRVLNQFTKSAKDNDCQRHRRAFVKLTPEQKRRTAENILAGDPVDVAIRDAKAVQI